jgi:hypothetical protein
MQQLKKDFLLDKNNKMYDWLDYKTVSVYAEKNNYQTWTLLTLAVWMQQHP